MDPINKMLNILNSENTDMTNARISTFVISHLHSIETLSIVDFANATFVSPATITRFIQQLGLESYNDFKRYFSNVRQTSKQSFLKLDSISESLLVDDPHAFMENHVNQIKASLDDTVNTLNFEDIDSLISDILSRNNVAILGYGDSNAIAKDIQLGFAANQKVIDVAQTHSKFQDIIERYDEESLVIILSNYGNFFTHFKEYYQLILKKRIPIICVTQNYNSMDFFIFKKVIYLNSRRLLNSGNYSMRLFSELLVRRLMFHPKQ